MTHDIGLEFDGVQLGNQRLNRRLITVAQALAKKPEESVCAAIGSFHECKGAYRLFANEKVTPTLILQPHVHCSVKRAKEMSDDLLVVHDSTDLIYTNFVSTEGLDTLTTKPGMQRGVQGIMLHNSMLMTESGVPVGVVRQSYFSYRDYREKRGQQKRNIQGINKQFSIESKASWRWIQHMIDVEKICSSLQKQVVHVADREGDIYEFLQSAANLNAQYVIRARGERRVYMGRTSRSTSTISSCLESARALGTIEISIQDEQGQMSTHEMAIKAVELTLYPPQRKEESQTVGKLEPIKIQVVEARSKSENSFFWRLLTNLPCKTLDQATRVIEIYKKRWLIECYHRVLKSGFGIEKARLKTRSRLENFCAIISVLGWRIMWLYLASRIDPGRCCIGFLSEHEIQAILTSKHCKIRHPAALGAQEAVRVIARLGGYLDRKSDGPPGMTTIWKGWKALHQRVELLEELRYG